MGYLCWKRGRIFPWRSPALFDRKGGPFVASASLSLEEILRGPDELFLAVEGSREHGWVQVYLAQPSPLFQINVDLSSVEALVL